MIKQYILPADENIAVLDHIKSKKIGVVVYISDKELYFLVLKYLKKLNRKIDIFFYVEKEIFYQIDNEEKHANNYHFFDAENYIEDFSATRKYINDQIYSIDYLCIIPPDKNILENYTRAFLKSYRYSIMENLIKSSIYINNVLDVFLKQENIDVMYSKKAFSLEYFNSNRNYKDISISSYVERACWIRIKKSISVNEIIEIQNNEYAALYIDNLRYLGKYIDFKMMMKNRV